MCSCDIADLTSDRLSVRSESSNGAGAMELDVGRSSIAPAPSEDSERTLRQSLAKSAMSQVHMGQLSRAMARLQSHGVHISNEGTLEQASLKFPDEIYPMPSAERSTTRERLLP